METIYLHDSAEVLELLGQAEAGVRKFYRACRAQWPAESDFWLGLAEEEGHYMVAGRLLELVKAHPERYPLRRRFAPGAYRAFIKWVTACTAGVSNCSMRNEEAVDISNTIETTILESRVQDLVRTADPEYLELAGRMTGQARRRAGLVKVRALAEAVCAR